MNDYQKALFNEMQAIRANYEPYHRLHTCERCGHASNESERTDTAEMFFDTLPKLNLAVGEFILLAKNGGDLQLGQTASNGVVLTYNMAMILQYLVKLMTAQNMGTPPTNLMQ